MLRAWPGDLPELTAEQAKQIIPRVEHTGPLKIAKRSEATGPQRSEAERPNPETDGLVTVELTREEAENLEMSVTHGLTHRPSNPPDRRDLYCPTCRAQAKLRAAMETPGPYAKAFRERVCPVPEFPGIKKEES